MALYGGFLVGIILVINIFTGIKWDK